MKLTIPIYKEIELSRAQMLKTTLAFLENEDYRMRRLVNLNGVPTWMYDDSDYHDAHSRWTAFRTTTEKEQLYYNALQSLKNDLINIPK